MGKSQKKKQMRRHNPVRVPDSHIPHGLDSASASSSKKEAILPIIQKLESVDSAERKWACVAVSNLIQNDPSTRRLLQGKNIVGSLITRLSDSEEEVLVEAAGALRNLCIDGGYDICGEMYNKNIIAPLKTFVPKISSTLSQYLESPKDAPENARKVVYELADNVITILWCLSETSNKALTTVNQISLVPFLMSFLAARDKLPLSTVTSAAQCLYVLTDDNPPATNEVRNDVAYTSCLLEIVQSGASINGKGKEVADERIVTLRVLCSGVLRHVAPLPPPSIMATLEIDRDVVIPTLQPVISSGSIAEASGRVVELLQQQESIPELEKLSLKNTPKSDHKSPAELELEQIENRLRTTQLALEVLTNVCATLPETEPLEDDGEQQEDEVMEDQDDLDLEDEVMDSSDDKPSPSRKLLPDLVAPLLPLIQPTPLSFPPLTGGASPHPPTTSALSSIHICAMECLNNIFWSLAAPALSRNQRPSADADREGGVKVWDSIWHALSTVGVEFNGLGQERRREFWYLSVGVLWGVGIVWKGLLVPNDEQIRVLIGLYESTPDPAVKVKCIGTLECLAHHPESIDANRVISTFFLSLLPRANQSAVTPVEPLLQTVSALIDVYSDEMLPYDTNFRQGNYAEILAASAEPVRKLVRSIDRKKERELRRRGEEVRDNLIAFIEYRRSLSF
ncbi:hypothetical protein QCA50_002304 [Cerrena zonata]|uniref:SYO1-like TPR repeats domain-containing protein n=1 Tax=Cerrena zonata TaxID=2478898 RepID=A0AAW0GTC4_9APHY